jgi:hypothetical protein
MQKECDISMYIVMDDSTAPRRHTKHAASMRLATPKEAATLPEQHS